jgi:hypothetical protein
MKVHYQAALPRTLSRAHVQHFLAGKMYLPGSALSRGAVAKTHADRLSQARFVGAKSRRTTTVEAQQTPSLRCWVRANVLWDLRADEVGGRR